MKGVNMKLTNIEKNEVLILDSTGPGVSSHFAFLAAVGSEQLGQFKKIHAFSGGIFAYVSHYACQNGHFQHHLGEYAENLDRRFIEFHHGDRKSILQVLARLASGKPAFSWKALDNHIQYIFSPDFLKRSISTLPSNFVPYLSVDNQCVPVATSSSEWRSFSIHDLLLAGSSIPFVYEPNSLTRRFSDAVFAENFKSVFKDLMKSSVPTAVATMWPRRNTSTVNVYQTLKSGSGKRRLYHDGLSIVFKLPMNHWRREVRSLMHVSPSN
jgi:hypothetical protein